FLIGYIWVVCYHLHSAAFQLPGYYGTDPAKAYYACRLVLKLIADEEIPSEFASPGSRICLRDVPEQAECMADSQFSCCHYIAFRSVYNDYALFGAGADIYIVYAIAGPSYDFQLFGLLNQFCIYLCYASDN